MENTQSRSIDRDDHCNSKTHKPETPSLTRNQQMIYSALKDLGRAAKAYELLDILRAQGVKAAPTVYRALHELEEKGLVKHLVASRSFTALSQADRSKTQKIMLVCEDCGETIAIEDKNLVSALNSNARKAGFEVRSYHLELSTSCNGCNNKGRTVS